MSSLSRELNTTTSSILFKNSGANDFLRAFSITPLALASSCAFCEAVPKPIPVPKSLSLREPMLDVIIMMVFLKSIFLPKLSVK